MDWQFFKEIIIGLVLIGSTWFITWATTKKNASKRYREDVSAKFAKAHDERVQCSSKHEQSLETIVHRMEIIVKALMSCNGLGMMFTEKYELELKRAEMELKFKITD